LEVLPNPTATDFSHVRVKIAESAFNAIKNMSQGKGMNVTEGFVLLVIYSHFIVLLKKQQTGILVASQPYIGKILKLERLTRELESQQ
jgi:hypothetical protein